MIALPIIIVGDGQVEFFASPTALEASVEAVDVHRYRAYDSRGRALVVAGAHQRGSVLGMQWVQNGSVSVGAVTEESSRSEELRSALLDWWLRTEGSPDASGWSLEQLVHAIAERDGVTA